MALPEFVSALSEFGVSEPDARRYFRVFNHRGSGALDYREFVVGLVLMDQRTAHGGLLGEWRTKSIFRLYDEDGDGYLSRPELEDLVSQLRSSRQQSVSRAEVTEDVEQLLALVNPEYRRAATQPEAESASLGLGSHQPDLSANLDGGAPLADETQNEAAAASPTPAEEARAPEQERVSQQQFLRAVGNLEVRGTSKLLRLTCPLLATARGGARAGGAAASTSSSLAAAVPTDWARYPSDCAACEAVCVTLTRAHDFVRAGARVRG